MRVKEIIDAYENMKRILNRILRKYKSRSNYPIWKIVKLDWYRGISISNDNRLIVTYNVDQLPQFSISLDPLTVELYSKCLPRHYISDVISKEKHKDGIIVIYKVKLLNDRVGYVGSINHHITNPTKTSGAAVGAIKKIVKNRVIKENA